MPPLTRSSGGEDVVEATTNKMIDGRTLYSFYSSQRGVGKKGTEKGQGHPYSSSSLGPTVPVDEVVGLIRARGRGRDVQAMSQKLSHKGAHLTPRTRAAKSPGQQLHRFRLAADNTKSTHLHCRSHFASHHSLTGDDWKLSSLVIPAVAYTEPEYATVGIASEDQATKKGIEVDVYRAGLEHNDCAICEGSNVGFCNILVRKETGEIVGSTIVAERAGEMINEVSLAIKNKLGLYAIGRNIHSYPTTGEAVMGCGVHYVNSKLPRLD
jgi:hypothetical protein